LKVRVVIEATEEMTRDLCPTEQKHQNAGKARRAGKKQQ
jgi:hypothetical protein